MKPRRWYSSPEVNPTKEPRRRASFPDPIYWTFTTRTHLEQGAIIKSTPTDPQSSQQRRSAAPALARPPRLIDAA